MDAAAPANAFQILVTTLENFHPLSTRQQYCLGIIHLVAVHDVWLPIRYDDHPIPIEGARHRFV